MILYNRKILKLGNLGKLVFQITRFHDVREKENCETC